MKKIKYTTKVPDNFNLADFIKKTKKYHKGQPMGLLVPLDLYKHIKKVSISVLDNMV